MVDTRHIVDPMPMVDLTRMAEPIPMGGAHTHRGDPMPMVDSIYESYILDPILSSLYQCLCRRSIEPFPLVLQQVRPNIIFTYGEAVGYREDIFSFFFYFFFFFFFLLLFLLCHFTN